MFDDCCVVSFGNKYWYTDGVKRLRKSLKLVGYDGGMTLEFVTPIDRTPVTKWPNQVETNPVDISPEQLKFIEDHGSSLLSEEFYSDMVKRSCEHIVPLIR